MEVAPSFRGPYHNMVLRPLGIPIIMEVTLSFGDTNRNGSHSDLWGPKSRREAHRFRRPAWVHVAALMPLNQHLRYTVTLRESMTGLSIEAMRRYPQSYCHSRDEEHLDLHLELAFSWSH